MSKKHAEKFIENAKTVHPEGWYDYSLVIDAYVNARTEVPLICNRHGGIFNQKPVVHYNHKCGCPECNGGAASTAEKFIATAIVKHGDRYDYSRVVYVDNGTHVDIGCPDCNNFFNQTPKKHLRGASCNLCHTGVIIDQAKFIEKAKAIWGDANDYSLVDYKNTKTPVTLICNAGLNHGNYEKTPNNHTSQPKPQGCPDCAEIALRLSSRRDGDEMLEKLKSNQSDNIDFSLFEYNGYHEKVTLICLKDGHGEFRKTYWNALQCQGCPICSKENYIKSSPAEERFLKDVADNCPNTPIVENTYDVIKPFELDGYFPEQKIGIEYCGLYWHSELRGKPRNYHRDKMKLCNDLGIQLITVFEDEYLNNPSIVINRIKHVTGHTTKSVYARKCELREIDLVTARDFLNQHHLQGYTGCFVRYGLFYNDELVSVMTFAKPNRSKGQKTIRVGVFEISRFASSILVVGGGSKLIKAFERAHQPNELYTYADLRWGSGDSYLKMGFELVHDTPPNYWYFKKATERKHRFPLRKNSNDDQSITEWENRKLQGWDRIWDCGHRKFRKIYPVKP
jgi:hypothetical protein